MHDPLDWIDGELDDLESQHLRRRLLERHSPQQAAINLSGNGVVNFGSNDYLGLAAERLNKAVIDGINRSGWGSGASPQITGRGELHAELEARLAEFEGAQAALLFTSGYAANVGCITSLVGKQDAVFSDSKNHASIIDGCRLSGARIHVYPHADVDGLHGRLATAGGFRRRLIVTDSLFSMDGDLAPLVELAELAERHRAMLMVDEAHATGVFGQQGRGVAEHLGVEQRVHVRVGTLSKALGSIGGFVSGPEKLIEWVSNYARTYFFSTASPEPVAAAALEALRVVVAEPERRVALLSRAQQLRDTLKALGWRVGNSASQIIPICVGQPQKTMRLHQELYQRGLFVPGIRPPSVPVGESLLRLTLSYGHTRQMIEKLIAAMAELRCR